MTVAEISTLLQSGVLSGLAILIVFRAPSLWQAFLAHAQAIREYHAERDEREHLRTKDIANQNATALAELTAAVHELREASRDICRFKVSQ